MMRRLKEIFTELNTYILNNADLNERDADGNTPAILAAINGQTEALRLLADRGVDLNRANRFGKSPIYIAASKRYYKSLKILVNLGADLNQGNNCGDTPALSPQLEDVMTP